MKKMLTMAILATGLVACSDEAQEPAAQQVTVKSAPQAEILSFIPADSPLLAIGGLSMDDVPQGYKDNMAKYMEATKAYMKQGMTDVFESMTAIQGDEAESITTKVKPFVEKWFINNDMGNLGFDFEQTQYAMYTVDLFPVLRLKLAAGHQMDDMLTEMTTEFDMPVQITDHQGIKVREYSTNQMSILVALDDDYLVLTGAPAAIKDQMIGSLLGTEKPNESLAQNSSALDVVKQKHNYVINDLFILDFTKVADYFINPSQHDSAMLNFLQIEDNMLSQVCKTEFTALVAKMPKLVAGATDITNDGYSMNMVLETSDSIGSDLSQLAGRIPANNPNAAIHFGMSFDIMAAKKLAQSYAQALVDAPFECEHLNGINDNASTLLAQVSQPLPMMVGNFKGITYSVEDLKLNPAAVDSGEPNKIVESVKGQLLVAVDNADALMGMAQMMVPQLADVTLNTDGSLVHLGDKLPVSGKDIPIAAEHIYGAMSENTIALSIGHQDGGGLSEAVKSEGVAKLLTFGASGEGYKNIMEQVFSMVEMPGMDEELKKQFAAQKDMILGNVFWSHTTAGINFTEAGLVIDTSVKF